jgi:hypothetical protein
MQATVNGFVRVFAKTRDSSGNSEGRNLLTAQEQATPRNPVKYFEVIEIARLWGRGPSPHYRAAAERRENADIHSALHVVVPGLPGYFAALTATSRSR